MGVACIICRCRSGSYFGLPFCAGDLTRPLPASGGLRRLCASVFHVLPVSDAAPGNRSGAIKRFWRIEVPGLLRRYLGQLLGLQTVSGIACLGVLLVGAIVVYIGRQSTDLALSLLGVGIATPFVLLFAFTRRALYLEYRSNIAAGGAVLYSAFLFAGLWFLNQLGVVSVFTAFLDMGAAAAATSMLLFLYVRPMLKGHSRERKMAVANEHWCYGRWALGSSLFTWISWNLWYAIVSSFTGLAATGTLKALLNLAMPVTHTLSRFVAIGTAARRTGYSDRRMGGSETPGNDSGIAVCGGRGAVLGRHHRLPRSAD